ncbi:hypothetical protein GGP94_003179 [Salinibacter ruber]|uniref:hypothetical protein n=1 Tax=Salinibacter ruber TaxID=146919 RepID=UPI002167BC53|nr:hypothetical protein [Salinibacter ruber]MCS4162731.1 hypothetical protein [Salinibacter ruber]
MTRLAALLLIAASFVTTAEAQERTFVHRFETKTVYLEVAEHWLEVWSVTDEGCMMYPSSPEATDRALRFKGGTRWKLAATKAGMEVTFPEGRTVRYEATEKEPEALCGFDGRDI